MFQITIMQYAEWWRVQTKLPRSSVHTSSYHDPGMNNTDTVNRRFMVQIAFSCLLRNIFQIHCPLPNYSLMIFHIEVRSNGATKRKHSISIFRIQLLSLNTIPFPNVMKKISSHYYSLPWGIWKPLVTSIKLSNFVKYRIVQH